VSGRLASKMLTLAPDCYGLPERALLLYLGTLTSEAKRQVYVGHDRMLTELGIKRANLYRLLARLEGDGLVVRLRNARAGTRQQYALLVDRDRPACGRHPQCGQSRVQRNGPSGSRGLDPAHAHEGPAQWTPNGERRINGDLDHLAVVDIADLRRLHR
jgi:hypothetical protein